MTKKRNQIKQMEFRICFEWGRNYEKKNIMERPCMLFLDFLMI